MENMKDSFTTPNELHENDVIEIVYDRNIEVCKVITKYKNIHKDGSSWNWAITLDCRGIEIYANWSINQQRWICTNN